MNTKQKNNTINIPSNKGGLRHTKTSKVLVLIAGSILFGFLFFSFFISKQVVFSEQINITAPVQNIFNQLVDLKLWKYWTVWDELYYQNQSNRKIEYQTDENGNVIKSLEYELNELEKKTRNIQPSISIERTEISTNNVGDIRVNFLYSLWNKNENTDNESQNTKNLSSPTLTATSTFTIMNAYRNSNTNNAESLEIVWSYQGDYSPVIGNNPLQKYFLIFTKLTLKRAYRQSLQNLKKKLQ